MTAAVAPDAVPAASAVIKPGPQRVSDRTPDAVPEVTGVPAVDTPVAEAAGATTEPDSEVVNARAFPLWPIYILAMAATVWIVKLAQPFLVPVVVAILISYALVRPVDALERMRVPRALGAALVVLALIGATSATMWAVWAQLDRIAEAVPRAVVELKTQWGQMKYDRASTISKLQGSAEAVQRAISSDTPATTGTSTASAARGRAVAAPPVAAPAASGVVERFAWSGTVTALEALSSLTAIYLLAYFLLVEGDNFRRRWISFGDKALSTRRITVQALNEVDLSVRRYLGMLFMTNALLGVLTYVTLLLAGVEDAAGWGVLAGLLHIIPYFGPVLVAVGVFITSLHQLGDVKSALYASLSTLAVATVIGTFAQTWMSARIAKMSASIIFVSILLFGWLWGAAGLLLAVPIAVIAKVVMTAVPSFNPIGELLGDVRRKK